MQILRNGGKKATLNIMGDVISFESRAHRRVVEPKLDDELFPELLVSSKTRRCVLRWVCQLSRISDVAKPRPIEARSITGTKPAGFVEVIPVEKVKIGVAASSRFPEWIEAHTDFDAQKSADLAAHYAIALGVIAERIRGTNVRENGGLQAEYWNGEHLVSPALRMPYRAAGTVALAAFGLEFLEFNEDAPYPPHIAGLANPLRRYEFPQLHNCFKIRPGEQGEFGCD
jgi:hypothetical protein